MNIDELEKLARAANPEEDWWGHGEGPKIEDPGMCGEDREFIAAANPGAILELIEQHKAMLSIIKSSTENYERMGEVCSFEGQPMIYASVLGEIAELVKEFSNE